MIKVSIDKGKFGCGIFIDLRKAFDTANHEILLMKLEHGIRDNVLNWFQSYLSNHKQYSIQDLEKTINKELNKLYLWLNVNR